MDEQIQLQNAAANNVLTYDTLTTKWNTPYHLTVSGTLQSPLTSLLCVSSGIIDGKVGVLRCESF